jgi:flagellar biosynthesis GTPase FlhF
MVGYEQEFAGTSANAPPAKETAYRPAPSFNEKGLDSRIPRIRKQEYKPEPFPAIEPPPVNTPDNICHLFDAKIIALVGLLGAGKTTTAAKIAGQFLKKTREPVGVISTDVVRPGGAALLSAYAESLKLHSTTALSAPDLRDRVARWNCRGPLIIDTRGCGSRDSLAISRLGSLLDSTAMQIKKFLVLSATENKTVAREALDAYSDLDFSGVILARVDQAAGISDCLDEVRKFGSEVVLAGTGERVPEDLMETNSTALLALENAR